MSGSRTPQEGSCTENQCYEILRNGQACRQSPGTVQLFNPVLLQFGVEILTMDTQLSGGFCLVALGAREGLSYEDALQLTSRMVERHGQQLTEGKVGFR